MGGFFAPHRPRPVAEPLPTPFGGRANGAAHLSESSMRRPNDGGCLPSWREASERQRASVFVMVMRASVYLAWRVPLRVVVPRDGVEPCAMPEKFFRPAVFGFAPLLD